MNGLRPTLIDDPRGALVVTPDPCRLAWLGSLFESRADVRALTERIVVSRAARRALEAAAAAPNPIARA